MYGTSILLGKISYIFFYRRIFVHQSFLKATWVILGVSVGWCVANVLQVFFICRPFASSWDSTVTAVCGNHPVVFTAIGAVQMVIDVTIMLLPVHFVSKLQMLTSAKVTRHMPSLSDRVFVRTYLFILYRKMVGHIHTLES